MLKNYLRVALRTLRRERAYALLNVAGLAVGIACCLLVGLYALDEFGFDRFHPDAERTFRLVETRTTPDVGDKQVASTVGPVGPTLVAEMPEVKAATRLVSVFRMAVSRGDLTVYVGDYLIAEPSFFDVFGGFDLVQGDEADALSAPNSVVLTETSAQQYFGSEDPMGQTLEVEGTDGMTVTGVLADPSANSHLTFSMLFSAATFASGTPWWNDFMADWSPNFRASLTYVVLDDAASVAAVETRLAALLSAHGEPDDAVRALALQPLPDVHFGSGSIEDTVNRDKRPITYVWILIAVGLFVLLIACVNYMNLATARAMQRAKEVGVRKAIGAHRRQVAGQFLSESVVLAFIAVAAGAGLAAFALPAFNDLTGKALALAPDSGVLLAALVGIALVVGLVAGSYPALFLSGFRPADALRGTHAEGSGRLRRGLVVTQFALSIAMIAATLTVVRQLDYVQSAPLGYEAEHLVAVDINSGSTRSQFRAIRAEMAALPGVQRVSVTSRLPGDWKDFSQIEAMPERTADPSPRTLTFFGADEHFLPTFEVTLAAGRNFDPARPADSAAVLLNQTAVRALGLGDPLGQRIVVPDAGPEAADGSATDLALTIIGVVEDFHIQSLHEVIQPLAIGAWNNPIQSIDYFTARIDPTDVPTTIAALRQIGEAFDPEHPFEYNFLDDRLDEFYTAETRTARIVGIAAGLAVFIACLGLLGLAAFVAERRRREIGVRKVLGASVANIVLLLSKDFAWLVLLAAALAAPLAYFGLRAWLDGFAYRIDLGLGVFLLASGLALGLALLTVSVRAARAARANPIQSLRYD